jgi:hypothetical protein
LAPAFRLCPAQCIPSPAQRKPELVGFGQAEYHPRSQNTSLVFGELINRLRGEGFTMSYTMEDFKRDLAKEYIE